jgi:hypothetical protein
MKNPKRSVALAFCTLAAVALVGSAAASAKGRAGTEGKGQNAEKRLERMEKRIQTKLAPKLGLDEKATQELVNIFKTTALERKAAMKKVQSEREALKALVESGNDAQINDQLDRLKEAMQDVPKRHAIFDKTRDVLTPKQQALLVLEGPKMRGKHMKKRHQRRLRKQRGESEGGFGGWE